MWLPLFSLPLVTKEVYTCAWTLCLLFLVNSNYWCSLFYLHCLWQFTMMVFIHCTGGPDITLAAHNPASRRASPAQVTLTDGVIPMPVVSNYIHVHVILHCHVRTECLIHLAGCISVPYMEVPVCYQVHSK